MRRAVLIGAILGVVVTTASAKVWIVAKDGSGDFTLIPPAIDAASVGDIILVRPGTYWGKCVINKGIAIVGVSSDLAKAKWTAGDDSEPTLLIENLPAGQTAVVASLRLIGKNGFQVRNCEGTAVLSHLTEQLDDDSGYKEPTMIENSRLVVVFSNVIAIVPGLYAGGLAPSNSTVVASQFEYAIPHINDDTGFGVYGASAFSNSALYLGECAFSGDHGPAGGVFGYYCSEVMPGLPGGAGLHLETNSTALVAGRPEHIFQAGNGGSGGVDIGCGVAPGGDGGNGINVVSGSAIISGLTPLGGRGGHGNPDGKDGQPTKGNVTVIDPPLPTARLEGRVAVGATVTLRFFGQPGQIVTLLLSTVPGLVKAPGLQGFPLFVLPGGQFAAVPLGTMPDGGEKTIAATVPDLPGAPGSVTFLQGVVSAPSGEYAPYLTNVLVAPISEP